MLKILSIITACVALTQKSVLIKNKKTKSMLSVNRRGAAVRSAFRQKPSVTPADHVVLGIMYLITDAANPSRTGPGVGRQSAAAPGT